MPKLRILPPEVEARDFCRNWFGISHLPIDEIVEIETESGYRKRCVTLLANVTGLKERAVRNWGAGIKFEKMPDCHKRTLGYALAVAKFEAQRQVA